MDSLTAWKQAVRKLDKVSPYPVLYPFVMSESERQVFDEAIKRSKNYLEFGLGGSTLRAIQNSKAQITSVESSVEWTAQMREYFILRYAERSRLHIFSVDIGPTENWGYPDSDSSDHLFESYSSDVFETIDAASLDLVLVDGRFRVACILKAILKCSGNENFSLLVHDFWNRAHYHCVLDYLDVVSKVDTIGRFSIKSDVDMDLVTKDYEQFKNDPR